MGVSFHASGGSGHFTGGGDPLPITRTMNRDFNSLRESGTGDNVSRELGKYPNLSKGV